LQVQRVINGCSCCAVERFRFLSNIFRTAHCCVPWSWPWRWHLASRLSTCEISPSLACGIILVKALCCKSDGHGLETRSDECIFTICLILPTALGPGVYSASNRNEYQRQKNNVSGE
jgi:hypothetical protein